MLSCPLLKKISPSLDAGCWMHKMSLHFVWIFCLLFFFFLLKSFHLKLAEIGSCTYERWDSWLLLAASLLCCLMTNPVIPLPWNGWCRVTAVAFRWKEIMMRDNYWKAHCNSGTKIWNQLETLSLVKAASYSHKLKPWNNGINFKKKVLVFFPTLLWYTASIS